MQDTTYFLNLHRRLWIELWRQRHPRQILSISVQLGDVSMLADRPGDLFAPLRPAEPSAREKISGVVDMVNKRFGQDSLTWGINRAHPGFFERG